MARRYFVYALRERYQGTLHRVTNNITRRLHEHRLGIHPDSYAHSHKTFRLVRVECCGDVRDAIRREKQLKGWSRQRKLAFIESRNPGWADLADNRL